MGHIKEVVNMLDWFFHLMRLKTPREMRQLDEQFRKDMRKGNLELARAMVEEGLTGERREQALAQIAEAERRDQ
jgi:hypothetical protein